MKTLHRRGLGHLEARRSAGRVKRQTTTKCAWQSTVSAFLPDGRPHNRPSNVLCSAIDDAKRENKESE